MVEVILVAEGLVDWNVTVFFAFLRHMVAARMKTCPGGR